MSAAEVIEFDPKQLTVFNQFESELALLEKENSSLVFDYASPKGNKEARSHCHTMRSSKTAIEIVRKEAKADALEYGRKVDSTAKTLTARIDAMIDVHMAAIREIEEKEAKRVDALKKRLSRFEDHKMMIGLSSDHYARERAEIMEIKPDDGFAEFMEQAVLAKATAIKEIDEKIEQAKQAEADQAELKRLRDEQEEARKIQAQAQAIIDQKALDDAAAAQKIEKQPEQQSYVLETTPPSETFGTEAPLLYEPEYEHEDIGFSAFGSDHIEADIVEAFAEGGISYADAVTAASLIFDGKIPHITIS